MVRVLQKLEKKIYKPLGSTETPCDIIKYYEPQKRKAKKKCRRLLGYVVSIITMTVGLVGSL